MSIIKMRCIKNRKWYNSRVLYNRKRHNVKKYAFWSIPFYLNIIQ